MKIFKLAELEQSIIWLLMRHWPLGWPKHCSWMLLARCVVRLNTHGNKDQNCFLSMSHLRLIWGLTVLQVCPATRFWKAISKASLRCFTHTVSLQDLTWAGWCPGTKTHVSSCGTSLLKTFCINSFWKLVQ